MYQFNDLGSGAGSGTAALSLQTALLRPPAFPPSTGERLADLRARLRDLDLVTDLGQRIGSQEWLRGFATCFALCYTAYSFAPESAPIAGASPPAMADAEWEEARALAISPLAYGADTGRRMAASDSVEPLAETPERPSVDLLATVGRGDGFARVLERAGVGRSEAATVEKLIAGAVTVEDIKPGTVMDVTLGRRPNKRIARPLDKLSFRARFDLKLAIERANGSLILNRIPIAVDDTPLRIQGRVGASLYHSARAAGAPAKAVAAYIKAVATQLDIDSVTADDRFDIIVEYRRAETGETETGKLLFAGLDRSISKDLQLMQWQQGDRSQWFEASGVGRSSGMLQRPVPGRVTSNFGMRRHPILGYSRMHKGMDFRAGYGTPILAATEGRVSAAGWSGGYGKQVRIKHSGGLMTSYSHMSRIVAKSGSYVKQGQLIGYVGSTGLSTGPHLHYELYKDGRPVNPATIKFTTRAQLSGKELAEFKRKLKNLLATPTGASKSEDVRTAKAGSKKPAEA